MNKQTTLELLSTILEQNEKIIDIIDRMYPPSREITITRENLQRAMQDEYN